MNCSAYGCLESAMSRHNLTDSKQQNPKIIGTGLIALDVIVNAEHNREPFFQAGGTCGNVLSILSFLGAYFALG